MAEFDCLDEATNVSGHHFVEASAGTGKTFAIEHVVRRLVEEHGYDSSRILAVTFTKAAARDLRRRIRATLRQDNVAVSTLHAFCYQELSQHAIEIGFPVQAQSPDDMNPQQVVRELIRDALKSGEHRLSGFQLSRLLQYGVRSLENKLLGLVTSSSTIPPGTTKDEYVSAVRSLEVNWDDVTQQVYDCAPGFTGVLTREKDLKSDFIEQLGKPEDIESTLRWKSLLYEQFEKPKKGKETELPSPLSDVVSVWVPAFKAAKDPYNIFSTLAQDVRIYVQEKMRELEIVTPDEMLTRMNEAIRVPAFCDAIRQKYDAIIIDEFQDTDPLQWSIFSSLFFSDTYKIQTLYLVGDPKQSIYSFRNADLNTYYKAKAELTLNESLETNYRSSSGVIDGLNTLFSHEAVVHTLDYVSIKSGADIDELEDGKKAVHFFEGDEASIYPYIAHEVQRLTGKEVAILVRDRFQAETIQQYLRRCGIPTHRKQHAFVTDSPLFSLMELFFLVMRDPFDMKAIKQLAIHPLVGLTSEEVIGERWIAFVTALHQLYSQAKDTSPLKAMDLFMSNQGVLERLTAGKNSALYAEYTQLYDLLASGFTFGELSEMSEREDAAVLTHSFGDAGSVTIMTMHSSKGLEFEIVFALGVLAKPNTSEYLLRFNDSFVSRMSDESVAALQAQEAEEMRQLYVALTRAKRRVYIPYEAKSGNSLIERFIPDLSKLENEHSISIEHIVSQPPPQLLSRKKAPEIKLKDTSHISWVAPLSFSSIAKPKHMFVDTSNLLFPPGTDTGTFVHEVLDHVLQYGVEDLFSHVLSKAIATPLEPYCEILTDTIQAALTASIETPYGTIQLNALPQEHLLSETEFYYTQEGTVYKGIIDLLFFAHGKWFVLDWKTTVLPSYDFETMKQGMEDHQYTVQAEMYTHAVKEMFGDVGGVVYLFMRGLSRGQGIYFYEP